MIDDKRSSFALVAEPSDFEKPFLKLLIYHIEIVDYEPKTESKDIFAIREGIESGDVVL